MFRILGRQTQAQQKRGLIWRLFSTWWRARLYWKLGKLILNAVRSLFGKRARPATYR